MGFLGSIGDIISAPFKSIGDVTGVHISPSGVSVSSPKVTLGDLLNIAGTFAAPGSNIFTNPAKALGSMSLKNGLTNLGVTGALNGNFAPLLMGAAGFTKDPSKMGLLDYLQWGMQQSAPGGLLAGVGQQGGSVAMPSFGGSQSPSDIMNLLSAGLLPVALSQLQALNATAGQREAVRKSAVNDADPKNNAARAETTRGALMGGATQDARRQGSNLKAQGYDPSFAIGLQLGMQNRAASAANANTVAMQSPQYIADQRRQQLSLMDPATVAPTLASMLGLAGAQDSMANSALNRQETVRRAAIDDYNNRPPSLLEDVLSKTAGLIPAMGQKDQTWMGDGAPLTSTSKPISNLVVSGLSYKPKKTYKLV